MDFKRKGFLFAPTRVPQRIINMKEVVFKRNGEDLHAALYGDSSMGVVLCPPHPLYGGNRYDSRLVAVAAELASNNISALCIDYKNYTGGKEEVEDVLAAISYMNEEKEALGLLGYSYGAVIASNAAVQTPTQIKGLVLMSPIKRIDSLEIDLSSGCPKLMLYGIHDPFVAGDFEDLFSEVKGRREKLALETDHFYVGFEDIVSTKVREFFRQLFLNK